MRNRKEKWEFVEMEEFSKENLDRVGKILSDDPKTNVHVSIFKDDDDDPSMTHGKMRHIKNYIIAKYQVEPERIQTSWFLSKEGIS